MTIGAPSFAIAPTMPAIVQPQYVDPFQQMAALMGMAHQLRGFPFQLNQFHSQAPDFDQLARVFRSDIDHFQPLREAAQRLMDAEQHYRSTRKPLFSRWNDSWRAVEGSYNSAMANARAIGDAMGIPNEWGEGYGGRLLAHIALTEHQQKLASLGAFRHLSEDAARYTLMVVKALAGVYSQMQPGGRLWEPVHALAQGKSRYEPDAQEVRAVRRELLPRYMPPVARAFHSGRPVTIYPPEVRDPRPVVARPVVDRGFHRPAPSRSHDWERAPLVTRHAKHPDRDTLECDNYLASLLSERRKTDASSGCTNPFHQRSPVGCDSPVCLSRLRNRMRNR